MSADTVKFPEITVQLFGENGNALSIIGKVKKSMRRGGCSKEDIKVFMDEAMSGDYDHLLQTAMATVNVE